MSSSLKTYTQETRWLQDLKLDLKQKLSSMLSFTEQEKLKSEISLEEAHLMAQSSSRDFYEIHLLLKVYENEFARGYLTGLDGRKLHVRSEHAALNTLLQAAGAIVMKKALVLLDDYAKQWNIDYKFIGNIHDEVQAEVAEAQAEKYGWLAVECLKAAGLEFDLRCPLDGEYKVGTTWAETH
jgi:DNA polymerase I-like protein with 3'-5' exonuclease and polymerase domains